MGHNDVLLNSAVTWQWMADLLQLWTDLSGPMLYDNVFRYPSALAEQLMADINPSIDIGHRITWERVVNNTYGWFNARVLFNQALQKEFERQQKHHAALNNLDKATEQLYDHSLEAEAQDNKRRAKVEADNVQLLPEHQMECKKRQEQAKVMGIMTSSTNDTKYPHWHCQTHRKTPGLDVTQPYATPKETGTTRRGARLNKELGLDKVYDPLASGDASPTPGPKTPPTYGKDTTTIPPIHLPTSGGSGDSGVKGLASGTASPVTKHDDWLLDGLPPGLPMEVSTSQAPGCGQGSSHETPMSLGSPGLPGAGCRGMLKRLVDSVPFMDAMKQMQKEAERKQLEEEELPYPANQEDDPDWM